MDAEVITASTGFIGSVVALLGALGGGIAFFIRRADKKREEGESSMLTHYREQLAKTERKIAWLEMALAIKTEDGTAWREQLIENEIKPNPSKWSAIPPMEDS